MAGERILIKNRVEFDGVDYEGLAKVDDIDRTSDAIAIAEFDSVVEVPTGIVKMPPFVFTYNVHAGGLTLDFLEDLELNKRVKKTNIAVVYMDENFNEIDRLLGFVCSIQGIRRIGGDASSIAAFQVVATFKPQRLERVKL